MKKQLLLTSFALVASFALKAQAQLKKFDEKTEVGTPYKIERSSIDKVSNNSRTPKKVVDRSYYYWENHDRVTLEIKSFLGKDKDLYGGDSSKFNGFYTYSAKPKTLGTTPYNQELYQWYNINNKVSIDSISALGQSLDTSKSAKVIVTVYIKDLNTPASVDTVSWSKKFGFTQIGFKKPIVNNGESFVIGFKSATPADSFGLAYTNSWFNGLKKLGTKNDTLTFTQKHPFKGEAFIYAKNPSTNAILGLIAQNFDFLTVPKITYTLSPDFKAKETVCGSDSLRIINQSHARNPILNVGAYFGKSLIDPTALNAEYIFGKGDTLASSKDTVYRKFATAGNYNVSAAAVVFPWASQTYFADTAFFNIKISTSPAITKLDTVTTAETCTGKNGKIVATVTGGTAPYQFQLDTLAFAASGTFENLKGNTYYNIAAKDANSCTFDVSKVLVKSINPAPYAISVVDSCTDKKSKVYLGKVTGGKAPYTYNFNNLGFTSNTIYSNIGDSTYTLAVKDSNGCVFNAPNVIVDSCSRVGIDDYSFNKGVSVYPNPANQFINIKLEKANNAVVNVYDLTGKVVLTSNLISGINTLNLSTLNKGLYIYQITNSENNTATGKFSIAD